MTRNRFLTPLFLAALAASAGFAHAQTPAPRVRGDITAVSGRTFQLKADSGQIIPVKLADKVSISTRAHADWTRIATGAFLGTTATPGPDGTLIASEVHVFHESMRGSGEGHRPMDAATGSTMTNATVASVSGAQPGAGRTMTNATVATVTSDDQERRMTLRYNGGEKVVVVPKDTPVVMVEPGDASLLITGAHVVVSGTKQSDGSMLVDRVQVGKDGFIPPI
jgi:hypothetical protein